MLMKNIADQRSPQKLDGLWSARAKSELITLRESADQREQRQVHCDDDGSDRDAEESDQEWLDQRKQVRDGGVDFGFVEVGDLTEHRVESAGLFTDSDHLSHHVRKHFRGFEWFNEAFAALNADPYLCDRLFDNHVTRSLRSDIQ